MPKETCKEFCADCGKVFEAGKNAFLCPECRKRRQSEGAKKARRKQKEEKK